MVGCVSGCVGTARCHTLLHLCKSVLSVGTPSLQEGSVKSVGELFWLRGVYPPTEQTGRRCSPTDFTDSHRWLVALMVAWVRQGCHTLLHLCRSVKSVGDSSLQEGSVQICEICGRKSQQEGSVNSVNSVGGNRSKKVRVKSVGELFWLRGVYPPTEQTGRGCSPTDFTDSHRWYVFGIL
mgnify:FL=1